MPGPQLYPPVARRIREATAKAARATDKERFVAHIKEASALIAEELRRTERELALYMHRQVEVRKQLLAQLETLTAEARKGAERLKKDAAEESNMGGAQ